VWCVVVMLHASDLGSEGQGQSVPCVVVMLNIIGFNDMFDI